MIDIHLTLIFMITAAIIAVQVEDLVSSVIAVGAAGIGLSMAFLLLKAPDLAIMQLVVEILSLIILIRATIRKDLPFSTSGRWLFNTVSTILFFAVFMGLAYISLKDIPRFGSPVMEVSKKYLEEGARKAGDLNVVGAITTNFRALDLLGEVIVLFAAIVGVLSIARKTGRSD